MKKLLLTGTSVILISFWATASNSDKVAELNATITKLNGEASTLHNRISILEAGNVQAHMGSHPLKCQVGVTPAELGTSRCTLTIDHNLLHASVSSRVNFDREGAIWDCVARKTIRD
jgi:hypothetical protein